MYPEEGEEFVWSLIWTSALSRLTSICDLDIDYHPVDTDEEKFVCFFIMGVVVVSGEEKNCIHQLSAGHVQEVRSVLSTHTRGT